MWEELASLGTMISEPDFSAIVLGSLPKNYDQFLSAMTTTASVLKQELNPDNLMQTIIDEFDRCSMRQGTLKEKGTDVAFFAEGVNNNCGSRKVNRDVECFNCHKKGHKKQDYWAKGGGKEGQGPRSKDKKSKGAESKEGGKDRSKESANVAGDEEGVWMAIANDSGDEEMADNEFEDFTISNDDLFFFQDDEDSEEDEVTDLAVYLKKLLKITPYNIPFNLLDIQDPTDSSDDDEKGAVAMQVSSESDNKVEINPYWSKIKVNELQGLRAPVETSSFNTDSDSMPDLVTMSGSDDSSIIFILTPPDSCCSEYSVKDNFDEGLDSFSDEEMNKLVVDEAEDGCTTVDATMLVNVGGSVEGVC